MHNKLEVNMNTKTTKEGTLESVLDTAVTNASKEAQEVRNMGLDALKFYDDVSNSGIRIDAIDGLLGAMGALAGNYLARNKSRIALQDNLSAFLKEMYPDVKGKPSAVIQQALNDPQMKKLGEIHHSTESVRNLPVRLPTLIEVPEINTTVAGLNKLISGTNLYREMGDMAQLNEILSARDKLRTDYIHFEIQETNRIISQYKGAESKAFSESTTLNDEANAIKEKLPHDIQQAIEKKHPDNIATSDDIAKEISSKAEENLSKAKARLANAKGKADAQRKAALKGILNEYKIKIPDEVINKIESSEQLREALPKDLNEKKVTEIVNRYEKIKEPTGALKGAITKATKEVAKNEETVKTLNEYLEKNKERLNKNNEYRSNRTTRIALENLFTVKPGSETLNPFTLTHDQQTRLSNAMLSPDNYYRYPVDYVLSGKDELSSDYNPKDPVKNAIRSRIDRAIRFAPDIETALGYDFYNESKIQAAQKREPITIKALEESRRNLINSTSERVIELNKNIRKYQTLKVYEGLDIALRKNNPEPFNEIASQADKYLRETVVDPILEKASGTSKPVEAKAVTGKVGEPHPTSGAGRVSTSKAPKEASNPKGLSPKEVSSNLGKRIVTGGGLAAFGIIGYNIACDTTQPKMGDDAQSKRINDNLQQFQKKVNAVADANKSHFSNAEREALLEEAKQYLPKGSVYIKQIEQIQTNGNSCAQFLIGSDALPLLIEKTKDENRNQAVDLINQAIINKYDDVFFSDLENYCSEQRSNETTDALEAIGITSILNTLQKSQNEGSQITTNENQKSLGGALANNSKPYEEPSEKTEYSSQNMDTRNA